MANPILIAAGVIGAAAIVGGIAELLDREVFTGEVISKEVKRYGTEKEAHDKYLVSIKMENGKIRTFENTDTLFYRKFNSSDVQASIVKGSVYRISTYGFRIPFFSAYENIINAQCIKNCP